MISMPRSQKVLSASRVPSRGVTLARLGSWPPCGRLLAIRPSKSMARTKGPATSAAPLLHQLKGRPADSPGVLHTQTAPELLVVALHGRGPLAHGHLVAQHLG